MTVAREARASRDSRIEHIVRRTIRPVLWLIVLVPAIWGVYALFTDNLGARQERRPTGRQFKRQRHPFDQPTDTRDVGGILYVHHEPR